MIETQADRLRKLRIAKGFSTAADAARAYGWPITTYQSHENGARGLKLDAAKRYAKAFNSTPAFIITGTGGGNSDTVNVVINVPLLARVSAGSFRYDEGLEEGAVKVPAVPRRDISAALQYSVIIDGPSVNLRIPDGAYAICVPYESFPGGAQHGQLVHVVRERAGLHEHTIKELRYTKDGTVLMPVSSDPRFQESVVLSADEDDTIVRIKGVVIGSFQPF
jgi:SOS-response transcriptional repressor LexA